MFVVTGNVRKNRTKPAEVFQEYNFAYDSDSISYIIKSVEPDIVIYTGALDGGFDWKNESIQAPKYIAGLTNVIINCIGSNIKQFVYLSSCAIFKGNTERNVLEDTEPMPMGNRNKAIYMGEKICANYNNEVDFSVSIARISEIYGVYKDEVIEDNICTNICKQLIKNNTITINKNRKHNLIYVDDAVDAIYKIATNHLVEDSIYNITSLTNYSEKVLVEWLEEITSNKIQVVLSKSSDSQCTPNYQSNNINQLGFTEKYSIEKGMKKLHKAIDNKSYSDKKEKVRLTITDHLFRFSNRTLSNIRPFVENILFFLLLEFFVIFTKTINFHEIVDIYLLYVILIAIIYGYLQAVFAVIFSIIGKMYITLSPGSHYITFDHYTIYLWILQIFTIGVLVGFLKDKYKRKYNDLNDENEHLQLELSNIKEINNSNMEVKSIYERRLINYKDSFARIYNIVSQLDVIEPERVIFKAVHVIGDIMNTKDVSIYTCDKNSQFCRLMAASSDKAKTMKKSLRISDHKDIYAKLMRKEIYVNSTLDPNYPIMASCTYKDGNIQAIIMLWDLPIESNNLYEINVFGVLSKLVERTMDRAHEYMESINKSYNRVYEDVLNVEAFEKILQLYEYGHKEKLVEYSLLKVDVIEGMSEEAMYKLVKAQIRDTDYIGINRYGETQILLTNANEDEAAFVADRLTKNLLHVEIGGLDVG